MHIFFIFSSWSFSEWQSVGIHRDFPHFAVLQQKGTSKLFLCRVSQQWSNVQVNEFTMNIKFTWRWCNARSDWLQEASQGWEWILFADHQFLVLVRYVAFDITHVYQVCYDAFNLGNVYVFNLNTEKRKKSNLIRSEWKGRKTRRPYEDRTGTEASVEQW